MLADHGNSDLIDPEKKEKRWYFIKGASACTFIHILI